MFTLSQTQNSLTIAWNEQQVLGYHFPEDGNRPFCHPLNLPGAPPPHDERTRRPRASPRAMGCVEKGQRSQFLGTTDIR